MEGAGETVMEGEEMGEVGVLTRSCLSLVFSVLRCSICLTSS